MSKSRSELAKAALARAAIPIVFALLGACEPNACVRESDCVGGYVCRTGRCALAADAGTDAGPSDGGHVVSDAGHDAAATVHADADTGASADANTGADADGG